MHAGLPQGAVPAEGGLREGNHRGPEQAAGSQSKRRKGNRRGGSEEPSPGRNTHARASSKARTFEPARRRPHPKDASPALQVLPGSLSCSQASDPLVHLALICCTLTGCSVLSDVLHLCSPLGERQRPRSASLQRLSSARRKPLATLGAAAAAAGAQSLQHPPAGAHQAAGLATAGSEICTRQHNALAALDVHAQPTEGCALSSACRRPAAEVAAAEEDHGLLSPISLPGSEDTPGKVQGPADWAPAGRTAAPGSTAPAASSAQREAVTRPPFQAAQPPMTSTGSGAIARQAKIAAQGGRRPDIAQTARHPPTKPQSTGAVRPPMRPPA